MADFTTIMHNLNEAIITYAQEKLADSTKFVASFGTSITQVTVGVFITVLAAMLKEVLNPMERSISSVSNNIQGQTDTMAAKADEFLQQKSNTPKIKPEAPEAFDGKPDHVMSFLAALTVYFSALKEENDKNMILYALSKIKGGKENVASRWADAKRIEIVNYNSTIAKGNLASATQVELAQAQHAVDPITNWETFTEQFRAHFMLTREDDAARDSLDSLDMGMKSCEEYTTMFNGYALLAGYNDEWLIRRYKSGLNKALRQKVIGTYPAPVGLGQWKERALALDKEFRRENQKSYKEKETSRYSAPKPKPQKDENAMEIDAISTTPQKCSHCTSLGKNPNHPLASCRRKLGQCLICGGKHHISDCTEKRDTGRQQQQQPSRKINFAGRKPAEPPTDTTGDQIEKLLNSLNEEDYERVTARFATGFP
jgi:hypothetical protein